MIRQSHDYKSRAISVSATRPQTAEARSVSHAPRVSTKVSTSKQCGKYKRLTLNFPHLKPKDSMVLIDGSTMLATLTEAS